MKKLVLIIMGPGIFLGLLLIKLWFSDSTVTFQSLESTTETGLPVFNEIKFLPGSETDIWIMRQSHKGLTSDHGTWDRLAIVVNKSKAEAKFYQLTSGEMNFSGEAEAQPLKARCFACHSNGPRGIRPNYDSELIAPPFIQKLQVALWNLRIKTYGRIQSKEGLQFSTGTKFKSDLPLLQTKLQLKSCTHCHSETGIRNALSLEQIGTANFMIKNGIMPPFPFQISEEDQTKIAQWNIH
jgi:hypothetical protein